MAKRGRKPKVQLDLEDQIDAALEKYLMHQPLTLDESALLLWQKENRPTEIPLSKARIKAIENSALTKLREGLKKFGINSLDDVLNVSGHRSPAKCCDIVSDGNL